MKKTPKKLDKKERDRRNRHARILEKAEYDAYQRGLMDGVSKGRQYQIQEFKQLFKIDV